MSRHFHREFIFDFTEVFLVVEISHFHDSIEVYVSHFYAHVGCFVRWIVESDGSRSAIKLIEVLDQHVGVALMLGHIGLNAQRILI